jgi:hypothetical protein
MDGPSSRRAAAATPLSQDSLSGGVLPSSSDKATPDTFQGFARPGKHGLPCMVAVLTSQVHTAGTWYHQVPELYLRIVHVNSSSMLVLPRRWLLQ